MEAKLNGAYIEEVNDKVREEYDLEDWKQGEKPIKVEGPFTLVVVDPGFGTDQYGEMFSDEDLIEGVIKIKNDEYALSYSSTDKPFVNDSILVIEIFDKNDNLLKEYVVEGEPHCFDLDNKDDVKEFEEDFDIEKAKKTIEDFSTIEGKLYLVFHA